MIQLSASPFSVIRSIPLWTFATLALLAAGAHAAPITINNYSFEDPAQVSGPGFAAGWQDWTKVAGSENGYTINNTLFAGTTAFSSLPQGVQYAQIVVNTPGEFQTWGQTTGETITSGQQYTLTVSLGKSPGTTLDGDYTISLWNVTTDTEISFTTLNTAVITAGTFVDASTSFTAVSTGDILGVRLGYTSVGGGGERADFDNVRLNSVAVPEPSGMTLVMMTGTVLLFFRRSRSRA